MWKLKELLTLAMREYLFGQKLSEEDSFEMWHLQTCLWIENYDPLEICGEPKSDFAKWIKLKVESGDKKNLKNLTWQARFFVEYYDMLLQMRSHDETCESK